MYGKEFTMNFFKKESELIGLYHHESLMITDERQLDVIIEDPNKSLILEDERGFSAEVKPLYEGNDSLIDKIRAAKEAGANIFEVSYDFFFGGTTRTLFPDSEKTIKAFKIIHDIAKEHGMGFSASIINPLDIGGEYVKTHKEIGYSWQYQEGAISQDGTYSVDLDLQLQWTNNKGPVYLELDRIVVFAFHEERIEDSCYFYVNPDAIENISDTASYSIGDKTEYSSRGYGKGELNIHGQWSAPRSEYDRCLAVAVYRTREIDYFAPNALGYIKSIIDKHRDAGISYQGFYSDEMHIQFDWGLDSHFGETEVDARYLTPYMEKEFAKRYGAQFEDFAKYLVYFSYRQHGFLGDAEKSIASQHVLGKTPDDIYRTWLLRKRYFEMLNERVVSLCMETKAYAESLFGAPIICRGHATWVESPTQDRNYPEARFLQVHDSKYSRYDYHKDYYFSSSIIEAMAACYDYFNWNDYYTGGGTDHGEDGYSDRNYYTQAFGASLAGLNRFNYGYAGAWGSPDEVVRRFNAIGKAYGVGYWGDDYGDRIVQGFFQRTTDVLALYPLDLVYVEERFGSWMVQYGYCNYITEEKLLTNAHINSDGRLQVKNNKYRALVVLYQPFIKEKTLNLILEFAKAGGKVLWMSTPPVLHPEDERKPGNWGSIFGIQSFEEPCSDRRAADCKVVFTEDINIDAMPIPSELRPDYVFPFTPNQSARTIATLNGQPIVTFKPYENGGCAVYAGFRVRDDQSCSFGSDVSTLFDLLCYMGAYDPDGGEVITRPTAQPYVINRFKNGAVSLANHNRTFAEAWDGLYFRDAQKDAAYLEGRVLPPVEIHLQDELLFGNRITYSGSDVLTYCLNEKGELQGFAGYNSTGISINGRVHSFTKEPARLAWSKINSDVIDGNVPSAILMKSEQSGHITIPNILSAKEAVAYGCKYGMFSDMEESPVEISEQSIDINVPENLRNHWIVICEPI